MIQYSWQKTPIYMASIRVSLEKRMDGDGWFIAMLSVVPTYEVLVHKM